MGRKRFTPEVSLQSALLAMKQAGDAFEQAVVLARDVDLEDLPMPIRLVQTSERLRDLARQSGHSMCSHNADVLAFTAMMAAGLNVADGFRVAHDQMHADLGIDGP